MTLSTGTRLGPYEILAPLGAGGMGEVWRARDTRLGRQVALKVLPEDFFKDESRKSRFEREAKQLAALSHPNIAVVYAFEEVPESSSSSRRHLLAMELLEGETLRAVLARGALPLRRALEVAEQMAKGLAAAHEKGIVHRDVKPENIFLTKDGHAKLLDFGIARQRPPAAAPDTVTPTVTALSEPGVLVGTVTYMSPEQARGLAGDYRSDQFSLGIVLYEMLAGRRPFKGASAAETLTAIIREEPEPLSKYVPPVPAPVRWLVERCLAKEPGERYDSTRDLARELSTCRAHLSEATSGAVEPEPVRRRRRAVLLGVLAMVLIGAGVAGTLVALRSSAKRPELKFRRLTFKRGYVTGARFDPDGRTVVYSAVWDGAPPAVYSVRLDALDAVPSGYPGANLLAVSVKRQLALSLQSGRPGVWFSPGTLAFAPFAGGTPRQLDADISFADFSPDGENVAITRGILSNVRLEYPSGTVLFNSDGYYLSHVRVSPSGEHVAFLHHTLGAGDSGFVVVVDRSGKSILRKGPFNSLQGLAWSPRGDEVFFGGGGGRTDLRAVTLGGRERVLLAAPVSMLPHDVAPDGRLLASTFDHRVRVFFRGESASSEQEMTATFNSVFPVISPDGSWVAFMDESVDGGEAYLKSTSGAPPVQLGPGRPVNFSADGRTLVVTRAFVPAVVLHPVGPGQPTIIRLDGFEMTRSPRVAGLFRDGKSIWFTGNQPSRPSRVWKVAVSGGKPQPVTPEGVSGRITADGASVISRARDGSLWIQSIAGGEARPVEGLLKGERIAAWTADGKPLFVYQPSECPAKIYRLDPKTGTRQLFGEIRPSDASGVQEITVAMTEDGKLYAYQVFQWLSELHLVEGLR